ncbi:uncharacterized protein LOC130239988 [Danio aesculapii]|uniref:uncharacterized protein LOC130239988 n=1 Tax=Danio aesculapii TaxID=1142201 RepID=UPI0024BF4D20|nr:uncharacterized protein LOC130239988 [Danio aesculapii]
MQDTRAMKDEASIRSPKQRNVRVWNGFFSLTCLAAVLECLFELFFNSDISGLSFMRYILDVIFFINIVSRFFIGYEVHGVVITDPKKVWKKYLRTWFLFDLLCVLPFQAFKHVHSYMRFLEASRCLRVFRLFSIISYFSKEPDTNKVLLTAFRMFSIMALSVQFSACLWFNQVCDAGYEGHGKVCAKGDNWLQLLSESNLTGISDVEWYATSVYWSVITLCTIGYGDIHATNLEEATVASVVMLLGLLAFGFSMSSLSTVISNMASLRGRFHHRIEAVLHYMMHMDLPMEIQTMVHHYYYYLWLHQKGRNITGLMDDLPNVLREDISSSCYRSLIKKAKLFRNTANGFKMALSLKLKTYTYIPGQTLAKAGEINQNLYYIKHGHVQVFSQNPEVEIATLLPGTLFGEVHLLYEIPRNVTIRASTLCEITILERKDLLSLFDEFPEAAVQISGDAKTRLQNLRCPIEEAYTFGLASIPQNVAFEREQWINLQPREQRIFAASFEYASNQIPPMNSFWKTTFHPQSAFIKTWRYFFSWCLTVSVFLETWVFFFTHSADAKGLFTEDWGAFYFVFKVLIYIVAAVDIFVNLRTDVFTKDGHVTDLAVIFQVYRKSWNFYYDVLALLPLELISFAYGGTEPWTVSCLVRLNRLLLIRRIYLYFRQNECDLYSNLYEQRIAKCLFVFFFCLHFCAGVLYLSACDNKSCLEESWAWNAGLKPTQSTFEHYIITLYWTTTTFTSVGYGDIVPGSLIEQCLAAIVGLIGMLVLTYVIGLMCATVSDRNAKRLNFQNVFSEMRQFMERHGVAASLQIRVKNYMNLLWTKYQGAAYPGGPFLMHDLPIELKHSVLMAERGELLSQIPFFSEAEQSFVQDLASTSVIYSFPEGEIIQYSNTLSTELFCILQGTCQILKDDLSEVVGHYYKGMFFGEAGFLFGKPATLTVRAMTCCKIVVIDFDKVKVLLEKHPRLKSQIKHSCANPQRYTTLVDDAKKLQERQSDVQDSPTHSASMRFQGSRNSSNSKCCVEKFGNILMYAGSEEEMTRMQDVSQRRPSTVMGRAVYFFLRIFQSVFLMRSAILPWCPWYVKWEVFRSIIAVAVSIASSLLFAFLHFQMELWIVCYILGLFCWVDMYIRMHVAFYKDNDLKVDTLETACHYFKTGFLLDFITCFPWELVCWIVIPPFSENGFLVSNEFLHFYAYLRIPHILQLYRLPLLISYLEADIAAATNTITSFKLFLYSTLVLNFCTCILFASSCPAIGLYENTTNYFLPEIKHNCTPLSWVTHLDTMFNIDFDTATFQQVYLMSLYFATSTLCTVGFGDIHPSISASRAGLVFIMLIGVMFVGWLSGSVTGMLANTDALRAAYTEKAESMKLFLKSHRLTGALYNQVIGFYKFRWMCTRGFDQDKLSEYLPSSLVSDLSTVLYADFIAKVFGLNIQRTTTQESEINLLSTVEITKAGKLSLPVFEMTLPKTWLEQLENDGCFIRLLAGGVSQCLYRASDIIYKKGDCGSEVYFVEKGEVEVLSNNESKVLFKLSAGQYFGERSLLFHEPRAATIRAATNCEMYVLSQKSLHEILKYYPHIHEQMQSSADEIKDLLHEDYQINTPARPDSAPTTFRRAGWEQLYRDHMAENEERAILRLQPLHVRLWTRVSPLLIWFLLKIFNFIRMANNRTMDADNSFRVVYQYTACILFTVLFWAITLMSSVHNVNMYLLLLTTCIQVFQMFEIFLKFHISTYDDHRAFASDYKSTSRSYLTRKFGFVFDMACAFPFGLLIVRLVEMDSPLFLPVMVIYARIAHLPRIISLLVFMWKEEQSITSNLLCIRMIKFFVHSVLFIHCAAMLCVSFVEIYGVMSWIAEIEITDFTEMYRYAVYWIVQIYTTVGFGDILSLNLGEVTACTVIMILSKIQVIYKMGLLIATQTNKNTLQVAFEAKLQTILEYMKHEGIPRQLQSRVSHFYNYQWNRNKGICTEELFRGVPRCLKMDVLMSICGEHLKSHHFFSHFTIPVMRELSVRITFRCFPVGECIYRKGDSGTEIYFLLIGKVNLCLDTRGHEVYQRLSRGAAFGDRIVIEHTRHDTAIAANYVDVAVLSKTSLESLSHLYPAAMHKLKEKLADIQQE